jgi:hypothetical protein
MSGYRIPLGAVCASAIIALLSVAFCMKSKCEAIVETRTNGCGLRGFPAPADCGCPVDTPSLEQADLIRCSLASLLSREIAESLKDEKLSLFLKRGGTFTMKNERSLDSAGSQDNVQAPDIAERIRRARERIELAKKIIYENELSAKLEHLKQRRTLAGASKDRL